MSSKTNSKIKILLQKIDLNKAVWQWAVLIFTSLLWGTSFILMKKGLNSYSHIQVGAFRMVFAFILLLPLIIRKLKKLKRKDLYPVLNVAFFGNLFPALLFATAQTKVTSSLAGMLNSLFPIIALIIGIIFYCDKSGKKSLWGVIIGLIGSFGLIIGNSKDVLTSDMWYAGYIFLAMIFYAISLNEIKYKLPDLDGVTVTAFTFLFAGPAAGVILLFTDLQTSFATTDAGINLFYIFLLAFFGSVVALLLFYSLVQYVTPVFAASITYIIPIFAIMWGVFDGETVSLIQIISMAVIFFGVYLVNMKVKNKRTKQNGL